MNMKQKPTRLKIEFKQFQRLPAWPIIIRSTGADRSLEHASAKKVGMAPLFIEEDRFGARSLAE
jgi:hypothetical protein